MHVLGMIEPKKVSIGKETTSNKLQHMMIMMDLKMKPLQRSMGRSISESRHPLEMSCITQLMLALQCHLGTR